MNEYKNHLRYSKYTLPNGRKVFLTQRPDAVTDQIECFEFIERENIAIRFQYTDDWVDFPEIVPSKWFVWVPGKEPSLESIWASTVTLKQYNEMLPIDFSFWMHCDSSSMRAPTYFGLFLHVVYPNQVEEISDTIDVFPAKEFEYASHSRPDKYASYSISREDGRIKKLIDLWVKDEKFAYAYLMNYPEGFYENGG